MPLTTGAGAITTTTGSVSEVLLAEQQAGYATRVTDIADFYKFQPRINSADLAAAGETIEASFLDGSAAQSKDAPGPIDIANGLGLAFSGNGTGLALAMLTQDKNPASAFNGTGGFPRSVDVVAGTTLLTSTATEATIADNLSSTVNPVRLVVTPSSTATVAAGVRARVTIEGTDTNDDAIVETLAFSTATQDTAATTRLWFKTVTKVTTAGWDAASGKTFGITARDTSARVTFTPQDLEWVRFWTALIWKGNVPNIVDGLSMESATVEVTRDGLVSFDCSFLGRSASLYQTLPTFSGQEPRIATQSALEYASADVFGGLQAKLTAENTDIEVAVQELTLTFNQNLAYTNVLGERFQPSPPARSDKRLTQIEATVLYAEQNNYSTYFEGNSIIPNVKLTLSQSGLGAYPYETVLEIPEFQLTADPDPAVADQGVITQVLTGKAVRPGNQAHEYLWRCLYSEYVAVHDFS